MWGEKKEAGARLLVLQLKMSSWPCNKSHRVVMCLLITVSSTLLFTPLVLRAPTKHTQPFLLYHAPPPAPHAFLPLSYRVQVRVHPSCTH